MRFHKGDLLKLSFMFFIVLSFLLDGEVAEARRRRRAPRPPRKPIVRYGEKLCVVKGFHCYTVGITVTEKQIQRRGRTITVRKKRLDTWQSLWPDEREREIVMKINRMSIRLRAGMVIAVPDDMTNRTFMNFSPYPAKIAPPNEKLLTWDPGLLAWAAYNPDGTLVRWGPGVGGKDYCPDIGRECRTPEGEFRIIKKGGPHYRSSKYPIGCGKEKGACAPMPWYMKFEKTGFGFHGSPNVVGYNASHGCVRCFTPDAMWLNKEFVERGMLVIIKPYPPEEPVAPQTPPAKTAPVTPTAPPKTPAPVTPPPR